MEVSFLPKSMFVYPVPRTSPQGRHNYSFVRADGTQIPAGRTFARKAEKRYSFPLSGDGMKIHTGLSDFVPNPFTNEEYANKYIKDQWLEKAEDIKSRDQITKQMLLEILHNRPAGTYSDEKIVKQAFSVEAKSNNLFEHYTVALQDGTNVFTTDTIDGQLAMLVMKSNPSIASSKAEVNPSLHDFYIGEENEAAVETANRRKKQGEAITLLNNLRDKYDRFTMYQLATVLRLVKGPVNTTMVNEKLDDLLWTQGRNLDDNINRFNAIAKKLKDKKGLEALYVQYVFQQAINTHVISVANGSFIWHSKKGIQNLYNLGTKQENILQMFYMEMTKYDPELKAENFYGDLITELKHKGVELLEHN